MPNPKDNKVEAGAEAPVPAADREVSSTDNMPKNERFEVCLTKFQTNIQKAMKYVREASEIALRHFKEHGDLVYCQRLFDAIPANYGRRAAYAKWLMDHAPVRFNQGKFSKDKTDKAIEFNLDDAMKTAFWEYAPDKEKIGYTSNDVVKAVLSTLNKFSNPDRYDAKDEGAIRMRAQLEAVITAEVKRQDYVEAQKTLEAQQA